MRSHPAEYEMVSRDFAGVLRLMDQEPGQWLPVRAPPR